MFLSLYLSIITIDVILASFPNTVATLNNEVSIHLIEQNLSNKQAKDGHLDHARRSIYDESMNRNGANGGDYLDPTSDSGLDGHEGEHDIEQQQQQQHLSEFNHHQHNNSTEASNEIIIDQQQQIVQQQSQKRFLTRQLIREACELDRGSLRDERINNTYLTHCSRYKMENLLSSELLMSIMHRDTSECEKLLNEFVQLDEMIEQFDGLFKSLLTRYNCHNGYSVKWSCDDCKKAYTDWICSTHLPFYMKGERIKPCISFCERVEQRCPYLHPITREQYGGQPVFICRDPNIPFVPTITPEIPYNEPGRCYDLCHVSDNLTELITDSLSKYDYDRCPDKSSIAEEVRNDPYYCGSTHCTSIKLMLEDPNSDYPEGYGSDDTVVILTNRTSSDSLSNDKGQTKVIYKKYEKKLHVHNKKLYELREVLANYKNQAKTHRYHADHSSIYHQAVNSKH